MEMSTRWRKELTWRCFLACAVSIVVVRECVGKCIGLGHCSNLKWGSLIWFQVRRATLRRAAAPEGRAGVCRAASAGGLAVFCGGGVRRAPHSCQRLRPTGHSAPPSHPTPPLPNNRH